MSPIFMGFSIYYKVYHTVMKNEAIFLTFNLLKIKELYNQSFILFETPSKATRAPYFKVE